MFDNLSNVVKVVFFDWFVDVVNVIKYLVGYFEGCGFDIFDLFVFLGVVVFVVVNIIGCLDFEFDEFVIVVGDGVI